MFRFTIRELVLVTVIVAMGVALWRERAKQAAFRDSVAKWWGEHLRRDHYTNPNDYKRLIMREGPPFSR